MDENDKTPLENARIKAMSYYTALKRPVFACDSGLYIDGLTDSEQPGIHVRMVNGKRLTDDEMVEHYTAIAAKLGGKAVARYKNAICLIMGTDEIYEHFGDNISGEAFCITDKPHPKRIEGFPLDCISVHIESDEYYYWHDRDNDTGMVFKGFQEFFRKVLNIGSGEQIMTEYISSLRKLVGHAPILQCGASVILINSKGELLLQRRCDNGCWGFHGGSVELDEVVEETAERELFEETGLTAQKLELFGVFFGAELHYVYPNGDEASNVDIVYLCREYSGELNPSKTEVNELRFFSLYEVPENISPPQKKVMNEYVQLYAYKPKKEISIVPYERKYHGDMLFCFLAAKDAIGDYAPTNQWSKPTLREDLLDIEHNYFENGDIFYLAIDERDRVVGMVGTRTVSATDLWLKRLFIKPELKDKGIGSKLLVAVEKYAVSKGVTSIHTRFSYWYREAAVFYPAKGFVEAGRDGHLVHMVKRLGALEL